MWPIVHGPRGKPITIVLLKEHNNKMISNDILLYLYTSVFCNHDWRSFFCGRQELMVGTTTGWCADSERSWITMF